MHFHSFPASAYHGPFIHLFRHHPQRAIAFIIELFNHSADWYGNQRVPMQYVESPIEMTLTFADGSTQNQWCNGRLWNLYRGTSIGPYALQSALMAFENWLLEFAAARSDELDELLLRVLRGSRSAALTAVVASVAAAFPHAAAETLLVFLRSPECILLDRGRLANESQVSLLSAMMPFMDATKEIYDEERKQANDQPHRRRDLEFAIANLQLGPNAPRVHEIIDRHLGAMPPADERTEDDRIWRLALHRMDLRQYIVAEDSKEEVQNADKNEQTNDDGRWQIRLDLNEAEPDVQQMIHMHTSQFEAMNDRLGLLMWGIKAFGGEEGSTYNPAQWRERLAHARDATSMDGEHEPITGRGGPESVASVCIRDHFEELSPDEAAWCIETVCTAVERNADNWNKLARIQRGAMEGDRPAAWVLSNLLGKMLNDTSRQRVLATLVLAVTHAIDEVRSYAASGIGQNLWPIDPELTMRCINVLANEAAIVQRRVAAESELPFVERTKLDRIEYEVAMKARGQFFGEIANDAYQNLDLTEWIGSEANSHILSILIRTPEEPRAVDAFHRLAHVLVQWWDSDDDRRGERRIERSHEVESALTSLLEEFLLKTNPKAASSILQPILDALDRHPREASWILQGVIGTEDRLHRTDQFWAVWELFASRVRTASWLIRIDDEHPRGSEVMATIFLTRYWKDDVRHWRSLEGHAHRVHDLFESLPPSATILDDYVRFLYHIGEQSLPVAFERVANRLKAGDAQNMLRKGNTVFTLETLLLRYVYGRPIELKRNRGLRESVLYLLDTLVENGSSASYRMRDDFVTPISSGI
jgi:hypothetical protein